MTFCKNCRVVHAYKINDYLCYNCNPEKNRTEKIVFNFLKEHFPNVISQATFDWCKNVRCLPFDILLDSHKIIIEIDGLQHFQQVSNWQSPQITQEWDCYKMKCAIANNYKIIRIFQEDVYYNKINWKLILQENVKLLSTEQTNVVYISKDNAIYEKYRAFNLNLH